MAAVKKIVCLYTAAQYQPQTSSFAAAKQDNAVVNFLRFYSPQVEYISGRYYYFDLSGTARLFGPAGSVVQNIINALHKFFPSHIRAGIARNKLLSFLAARSSQPGRVKKILPAEETNFLEKTLIGELPVISRENIKRLKNDFNITYLKELQLLDRSLLHSLFPLDGELLYNFARGNSQAFLYEQGEQPFVRQTVRVIPFSNDNFYLERLFSRLLTELCFRLRCRKLQPAGFVLCVVYADAYTRTISRSIAKPSCYEQKLKPQLRPFFRSFLQRRTAFKKINLCFNSLQHMPAQLTFFTEEQQEQKLCRALDRIRCRFGRKKITYAGF